MGPIKVSLRCRQSHIAPKPRLNPRARPTDCIIFDKYIMLEINYGGEITERAIVTHRPMCYAELGSNIGHTARKVALALPTGAEMHLFDYHDCIERTKQALDKCGRADIRYVYYPNSRKTRDSYCWALMDLIAKGDRLFDYVYIDGSHDLTVDGFAFFLVDRLLKIGGLVEFDDYRWTFETSPTLSPGKHPATADWYTQQQIKTPQVKMIVDRLVKPDMRYQEVLANRIFKKGS